jgi:hypothetical protein
VIALIAVIVSRSASFVAIVVMIVAGPNPYATGTNIDFRGKGGCRKDESGGCDCGENVSTHWAYSLVFPSPPCCDGNSNKIHLFL